MSEVTEAASEPRVLPGLRVRTVGLLLPGSIFLLGVLMRVGAILNSRGGVKGNYGYDASVYYTAADAFIHGRMPYQDFVLLHPPGLMLVLAPFAALGSATTDLTGFVVANLALAILGAVNAVLVYAIARRMQLPRYAAWLGGAFYAVWFGAVNAEVSTRLEPLGSFAFLCAMLVLTDERLDRQRRTAFMAGIALGFATSVKIWWLASLVITALWLLRTAQGWRRVQALVAGSALVWVVVDLPFAAMAPRAMIRFLFLDQIGRGFTEPERQRLLSMSTWDAAVRGIGSGPAVGLGLIFVLVLLGLCFAAWSVPMARLAAILAVVHTAVLLAAPAFFPAYMDFVAPALAIVVAAAAVRAVRRLVLAPVVAAVVVVAAGLTATAVLFRSSSLVARFPQTLAAGVPAVRCVTSVTPIALIETDVLSRNLGNGCRQWVDSYGRTYSLDKPGRKAVSRKRNKKWQLDVRRYLLSGDAVILIGNDASLSSATLHLVTSEPLVTHVGGVSVYRVAHRVPTR